MTPSETDGFKINRKIQDIVKQNFKMLLLTMPGERVMDPAFGCGIKYALFEQFSTRTYDKLRERIKTQTAKYIPPIEITKISFDDSQADKHQLNIRIEFKITSIGLSDFLDLVVR
jgi:phage baseplate assembly protein W